MFLFCVCVMNYNSIGIGIKTSVRRIKGVEDLRETIWRSNHDFTQLGHGRLNGHVVHILLGEVAFSFGHFDKSGRIRGYMAPDTITFGTFLSQAGPSYHWGVEAKPGDIAIFSVGCEKDIYLKGGVSYAAVTIPAAYLVKLAHIVKPKTIARMHSPLLWRTMPVMRRFTVASLRTAIATSIKLASKPQLDFKPDLFALTLLAPLIAPLDCEENGERSQLAAVDLRFVLQAEDILRSNDMSALSMPELCLDLGVSRRTLERAFRRTLDMSPSRYLMLFRLCRAREDLVKGEETISNIAMKHGFYELGRFSRRYKQLFDELPSETLAARRMSRSSSSSELSSRSEMALLRGRLAKLF